MNTNWTHNQAYSAPAPAGGASRSQVGNYLASSLFMFALSVGIASTLDLLPEAQVVVRPEDTLLAAPIVAAAAPELPTKIVIPAINLEQNVVNPTSTDINVLDRALTNGTVRYPTSSKLGEAGNVIIFGHSSYLPVVNHQSFKAFNGIQKLERGDQILVTGKDHVFVYAVQTVEDQDAATDAIPLYADGNTLTLATCDSFGSKSDRFVVTATLVETRAL